MKEQWDPDYVVAPAAVLQEWLDENHLSVNVACAVYPKSHRTTAAQVLNDVLLRKPYSPFTAGVLAHVTSISVGMWRGLEHNYRVGLAAGKHDITEEEESANQTTK